ncbi:MAG TPA: hypothetical protein V6C65_09695 [Allocoleopsis sp.]
MRLSELLFRFLISDRTTPKRLSANYFQENQKITTGNDIKMARSVPAHVPQ